MPDLRQLQSWFRWKSWLGSDNGARLLLGCLTFCALIRVLWADFLGYDDPFYVTNNSLVQGGLSWNSLARAGMTFECANWHPLTWMSLMLDHQIYGLQPWGFHLTNLMLHVANTLLLFGLLRRLSLAWGPALFVSAVFGVHPLHVESVAWITERKDVLATFFGLLALLDYVRGVQTGTRWRWFASIGWFALSLMSKPLLVTLPCLLLLLDGWPLGRGRNPENSDALPIPPPKSHDFARADPKTQKSFAGLVLEKWPFWLLSLGSAIITVIAQHSGGAVASLQRFGLGERLANVCVSYCTYLNKSFWPTRLAVYYPYSLNRWDAAWVAAAVALLGIITVLAWRLRRPHGGILLGWLWFLGTLVPMIGIVQVGTQAMADRYMYFPLIGLTWAVMAAVLAAGPHSAFGGRCLSLLAFVVVAVLSGLTWQQTGYWQNSLALSRHALRVTEDNHVAHELHARALRIAGLNEPAIAEYRRAIAIKPDYFSARNDLGLLLVQQGDLPAAIEQFQLGLKTVPHHGRLHWNLALALGKQRRFDASEAEFRLAELQTPHNDALVLDHARMLQDAGRFPAALTLFERAVALAPDSLINQLELALALGRSPEKQGRDLPRSIALLEQLCVQTDAPRTWIILAEVRIAAGHSDAARTAWNHAIQRATQLNRPDLADLARASQRRHGTP